ncbi:MAG: peptidoglycan DD-metalloendopeptidase family protein [Bifidobacteriaceae bacterium]|jgi:murein DD-endopeptidase MepM/ murein hydrolase activator NlpD|nr:peptidoglycan DD-metalloendopeptidase family protein [Bifidobacteriaceae bacterium]
MSRHTSQPTGRHRALTGLICLAFAAAAGLTGATAQAADDKDDLAAQREANQAEIDRLAEDLEGTSQELVDTYLQLEAARMEVPLVEQEYADAQEAYVIANQEYQQISASLTAANNQYDSVSQQLADDEATLETSKLTLGRLAREAMAQQTAQNTDLMVLLGATDLDQIADDYMLARAATRTQRSTITKAQQAAGELGNRKARLDEVTVQIEDLKVQAADALAKAEAAREEAEAKKAELDALVASLETLSADLEAQKAADEARQAELEAENAELQAQIDAIVEEERRKAEEEARRQAEANNTQAQPVGQGSGPAPTSGFFGAPLSVLRMTSPFGYRIHPIYGTSRLHAGIDYGAACGTPIYASASGTVVQSGWSGGYGNRVVVNHGMVDGAVMMTTYNHQSQLIVSVGQSVTKGEQIGVVGTTGASTGCHLHFEIMVNGAVTDPAPYLQ